MSGLVGGNTLRVSEKLVWVLVLGDVWALLWMLSVGLKCWSFVQVSHVGIFSSDPCV